MRKTALSVAILLTTGTCYAQQASQTTSTVPVLVELFTSEGCSSCPPADRFIEYLDTQPIAGTNVVVLSEHVDYWNRQGWKDPYSSHDLTERQYAYGRKFQLKDIYTPQFVVDGTRELTANSDEVYAALRDAAVQKKLALQLTLAEVEKQRIKVHLEADRRVDASKQDLNLYIAVALDHAKTMVTSGENAKKELRHTAVVRKMTLVGNVHSGELFSRDIDVKIAEFGNNALRVVAFLQEPGTGSIHGVAMAPVPPDRTSPK